MNLYTLSLLCGLLYFTNEATALSIEISRADGTPVTATGTLNAKLGETVTVKCAFTVWHARPDVLKLWYKGVGSTQNEEILMIGSTFGRWKVEENYGVEYAVEKPSPPYHIQLTIKKVAQIDAGTYKCVIATYAGVVKEEFPASLAVAANTADVELESVVLEEGVKKYKVTDTNSQKMIVCRAYNGSEPAMAVKIDGTPVGGDLTLSTTSPGGMATTYKGELYYTFSPTEDGKKICCESTVPGYEDEVLSDEATLEIQSRPVVDCPDRTLKAGIDDKVLMRCTITGKPLPRLDQIGWQILPLAEQQEANSDRNKIGLTSVTVLDTATGIYNAELTVTILGETYHGTYTLTAENEAGGGEAIITLSNKRATVVDDGSGGSTLSSVFNSLFLLLLAVCLLV